MRRRTPAPDRRPSHPADRVIGRQSHLQMNRREFLLVLSGVMTAVWGLRAEQKPMPVIGYLSGVSPGDSAPALAAFRQGLGEAGYAEGQSVAIEYRWAEFQYDRASCVGR